MEIYIYTGLICCGMAAANQLLCAWRRLSATNDAPSTRLSDPEQARLDGLFRAGRRWYRIALGMAVSSLLLLVSSTEVFTSHGLSVAASVGALAIFVVALFGTMASTFYFLLAVPQIERDPRRVPFAWLPVAIPRPPIRAMALVAPLLVCSVAVEAKLDVLIVGSVLTVGVFFLSAMLSAHELMASRMVTARTLRVYCGLGESVTWAIAMFFVAATSALSDPTLLLVSAVALGVGTLISAGRGLWVLVSDIVESVKERRVRHAP